MANKPASRPSVNRKTTPSTERARKKQLDAGVSITVDGKTHTVRVGDLKASDTRALRRELGMSFIGLQAALETDPDIDLIAGVVWLARRINGEYNLTYDEVADAMGYDLDIDVAQAGEPEADEDLKASAGNS